MRGEAHGPGAQAPPCEDAEEDAPHHHGQQFGLEHEGVTGGVPVAEGRLPGGRAGVPGQVEGPAPAAFPGVFPRRPVAGMHRRVAAVQHEGDGRQRQPGQRAQPPAGADGDDEADGEGGGREEAAGAQGDHMAGQIREAGPGDPQVEGERRAGVDLVQDQGGDGALPPRQAVTGLEADRHGEEFTQQRGDVDHGAGGGPPGDGVRFDVQAAALTPSIRTRGRVPAGTRTARSGGTVQVLSAVSTIMTPVAPWTNCARRCSRRSSRCPGG